LAHLPTYWTRRKPLLIDCRQAVPEFAHRSPVHRATSKLLDGGRAMTDFDDYPVVTENAASFLNQRQLLDYCSERKECLAWLLT